MVQLVPDSRVGSVGLGGASLLDLALPIQCQYYGGDREGENVPAMKPRCIEEEG